MDNIREMLLEAYREIVDAVMSVPVSRFVECFGVGPNSVGFELLTLYNQIQILETEATSLHIRLGKKRSMSYETVDRAEYKRKKDSETPASGGQEEVKIKLEDSITGAVRNY